MDILKRILSVILGLAAAIVITMTFEWAGQFIVKMPSLPTAVDRSEIMNYMPMSGFIWLLIGYVISSFAGGLTATLVSGRTGTRPAIIVGIILTIGGLINLSMIHHPLWFVIVSTLIYIPCAQLGCRLIVKKV